MKLNKELLRKLPKTDLHVHLDGSLRLATILELAQKQNIELPSTNPRALQEIVTCSKGCKSLDDYLKGFEITLSIMQTENSLQRIAYELAEDAAAENILYMEVRFSPLLHRNKGLKPTKIVESVLAGLKQAEKEYNIRTGIIICGIRNMTPASSLKMAKLAVDYKDRGVVGFDLSGSESNYPAKEHIKAFELAAKHNINITVHAGEAAGAQSIRQAIYDCRAHRIGHGIRLHEDNDLLDYVNNHRIPLEVCLQSNLDTNTVRKIAEHPVDTYLKKGLRVTLNTDNRLISNTTLTDEYMLAVNKIGWNYSQVKRVILNGFKSAFLPYQKKELIKQAIAEISKIETSNK